MILLVVLTAAADFFVSHYISEWEYRHRDEREQYDKELHYFLTQPRQIQLAKDIRVFGLALGCGNCGKIHEGTLRLHRPPGKDLSLG